MAQGVAVAAGAVVELSKLDTTVQGLGSYTVPVNRVAMLSANCRSHSKGWVSYNDTTGEDSQGNFNDGNIASSGDSTDSSSASVSNIYYLSAGDSITISTNTTARTSNSNNAGKMWANYWAHFARLNVNGVAVLEAKTGASAFSSRSANTSQSWYVGVDAVVGVGWNATLFIV